MEYKNDKTKNRRRYKSRYRSAHSYKQKRSSSQSKAAVLVSVLTFVVIASLVIVFTFGDSIYVALDDMLSNLTATDAPTEASTKAPTEPPTVPKTEPPTEPPTDPPVEQDAQFTALLESSKMKLSDITAQQLMFAQVNEENSTCTVTCYEKDDTGLFVQPFEPISGYIGLSGADTMVAPNESKTPLGLFKIEYAFGTRYNPGTALKYTTFSDADYWITDPNSQYYNRWMTTYDIIDWESSQWLFEYTVSYPYAIVFDYNRDPVDHNQGCAKFIHVSYEPTSGGGIGLSENDILSLLYWLNPSKEPQINIFK